MRLHILALATLLALPIAALAQTAPAPAKPADSMPGMDMSSDSSKPAATPMKMDMDMCMKMSMAEDKPAASSDSMPGMDMSAPAKPVDSQSMPGMDMSKPASPHGMMKKQLTPSTSLTLVIGPKTTVLTLAQLAAMPHKTVTVHNIHTKLDETYSGIPLADLLTANGAPFTKATQHHMLSSYLLAQGTDGYSVIYSAVEVFPDYHTGDVIIADALGGKPIATGGALKLVSSEDKHPMRWVQSLSQIVMVSY